MRIIRRPSRRRTINELKQFYRMNDENTHFIIEVSADSYSEIFNGWDPSPMKKRDLDPDMMEFIVDSSEDIPPKFPIELHFYLPLSEQDEEKESLSIAGIRNNFQSSIMYLKKELGQNRRKTFEYVILSVIFLLFAYFLGRFSLDHVLLKILYEGLFVGGWVFLWEAFSIIFFSDQEISRKLKHYYRFLDSPIQFFYLD